MRLRYWVSLMRARLALRRRDRARIPRQSSEIRLFTVVRNEAMRLPYWLRYYRARGVDRIFAVIHHSTDGSFDLLRATPATHLFTTGASYAGHWRWVEYLLETYGRGHWCVVADADEILIYPHWEVLSLRDLCAFLDGEGSTALHCLLLDMYARGSFAEIDYRPGEDPLRVCPHFDTGPYAQRNRRRLNRKTGRFFDFASFHDGMRQRVFGLELPLSKIPLLRYGAGTYLAQGMHTVEGAALSPVRGAVLHFKFLQDFPDQVRDSATRESHWKRGRDSQAIASRLVVDEARIFHPRSGTFSGSDQLVDLGLMRDTQTLHRAVRRSIAPRR